MTTALPSRHDEVATLPPPSETAVELVAARVVAAKALVSELIAGCPQGALLDAEAALREHPELVHHKSALMELAYEDFCRRDDLGQPVEPAEFARRFPTIYRSLLHQIGIHQLLVDGAAHNASPAEQDWPAAASAWLDFELLEELGRGAFSRVYLAREQTLGRRLVVVKATPLGPREAQTLGMLQHPHVVPVHSVQRDHELGLTAVCMPYLSRVSMFDVLDELFSVPSFSVPGEQHRVNGDAKSGSTGSKGALPKKGTGTSRPSGSAGDSGPGAPGLGASPLFGQSRSKGSKSAFPGRRPPQRAAELLDAVRRLNGAASARPDAAVDPPWPRHWRFADAVLQIGVQLAQALQHAHEQGVRHGDVKPSNILITSSGRAVLLDFNLAIFGEQSGPIVAGTLPYMAPEQLRGLLFRGQPSNRSVDERTDIFSLGLTLFELLYGEPAFGALPGENSRELIAGRLLERHAEGPKLQNRRTGDSTRRIGEVIVRCLAYDPAQRPQSMNEVAVLLAAEMKPARRVGRWLREHRRLTLATTSLVCAGALALGGWQMSRDPYPIREWKKAEAAYDRGDDAAAVAHATEALRADPKQVEARLLRGIAYSRQKDLIAARADLEPLSDEVPDGRAAAALAHAYRDVGRHPGLAGLYYQKAIDQGFLSPTIYNNLGNCLYQVGRLDKSAIALETAISLDPQLGPAHHNLASLELRNAGRRRPPDTASLERALRLGPQSLELDLEAAWIYARRAKFAAEASRQVEVDNVFHYLQDALTRGMTRQNLDDLARSDPILKADDRWSFLETRVQAGSTNKPTVLLIDPIPEIRSRKSPVAAESARR